MPREIGKKKEKKLACAGVARLLELKPLLWFYDVVQARRICGRRAPSVLAARDWWGRR